MRETLDRVIQFYDGVPSTEVDHATVIINIHNVFRYITEDMNIYKYILNVVKNEELSYMQYDLLLSIVKIIYRKEHIDIETMFKYLEDTTGHKKYKIDEINEVYIGGVSITESVIRLMEVMGIRDTIIVLRVLATFSTKI